MYIFGGNNSHRDILTLLEALPRSKAFDRPTVGQSKDVSGTLGGSLHGFSKFQKICAAAGSVAGPATIRGTNQVDKIDSRSSRSNAFGWARMTLGWGREGPRRGLRGCRDTSSIFKGNVSKKACGYPLGRSEIFSLEVKTFSRGGYRESS